MWYPMSIIQLPDDYYDPIKSILPRSIKEMHYEFLVFLSIHLSIPRDEIPGTTMCPSISYQLRERTFTAFDWLNLFLGCGSFHSFYTTFPSLAACFSYLLLVTWWFSYENAHDMKSMVSPLFLFVFFYSSSSTTDWLAIALLMLINLTGINQELWAAVTKRRATQSTQDRRLSRGRGSPTKPTNQQFLHRQRLVFVVSSCSSVPSIAIAVRYCVWPVIE